MTTTDNDSPNPNPTPSCSCNCNNGTDVKTTCYEHFPDVPLSYLIRLSSGSFIVGIDAEGDIDWMTYNKENTPVSGKGLSEEIRQQANPIIQKAAVLESLVSKGWTKTAQTRCKRLIGEAIGLAFEGSSFAEQAIRDAESFIHHQERLQTVVAVNAYLMDSNTTLQNQVTELAKSTRQIRTVLYLFIAAVAVHVLSSVILFFR